MEISAPTLASVAAPPVSDGLGGAFAVPPPAPPWKAVVVQPTVQAPAVVVANSLWTKECERKQSSFDRYDA